MFPRCLCIGILLTLAETPSNVVADTPHDAHTYKTVDELFSAYKKATEGRDWKSLFLLGTPERQDSEILMLAVGAATSSDATLRSLVEKHGLNWKQFDHPWTEADNRRLRQEYPALAASVAKQVREKPELFAEATNYINKKSDLLSTKVHELRTWCVTARRPWANRSKALHQSSGITMPKEIGQGKPL